MEHTKTNIKKLNGIHYTPKNLAQFVSNQIINHYSISEDRIRVLDPAVGDGALLLPMIKQFNFPNIKVEVYGFDINESALEKAKENFNDNSSSISLQLAKENFVELIKYPDKRNIVSGVDKYGKFDIIISNPPYVRTQHIGAQDSQLLSKQFNLQGRIDLYYVFIVGISRFLRPGGVTGIIVSNRFMTTKSGGHIRSYINNYFDIIHVWDLGDTRLFEAAVLPAILLLKRKGKSEVERKPKFTSIYTTNDINCDFKCSDIIDTLSLQGKVKVKDGRIFEVKQGFLSQGFNSSDVWRISTNSSESWLKTVNENKALTFRDVGKIRVGVKTTADTVFIRTDWFNMPEEERPELLYKLVTHHIARAYKSHDPQRMILYTHKSIGGKKVAINLEDYPRSARYLEKHRSILESREYVLKSGRNWYEIWVPQNPQDWCKPKLIFRDIAHKPVCWIDLNGYIVNGDCYWLTCEKAENVNLLWLALAVGNSSFITEFYDNCFNNKLYSHRRRFMTQYIEKFPLPNPNTSIGKKIVLLAKEVYQLKPEKDTEQIEKEIDNLVWEAFGLPIKEVGR